MGTASSAPTINPGRAERGGIPRVRRFGVPAPAPGPKAAIRAAAPALLGYAAVRLVGVAVLGWWAHSRGADLGELLARRWDSVWYLGIVRDGYDPSIPPPGPSGKSLSNLAFFPLYPALIRTVSQTGAVSAATAGLLVSWTFSLAAAWGIYAVGRRLHDHRTGVVLAMLWGVLPHALTESMAYTEPVFTAFAAWALYSATSERWISAGLLSTLAGLTRPTGIALAAAVSLTAAAALWQYWRAGRAPTSERSPAPWRILAGAVLAPLGWFGYVGWVGLHLHRWDGYFLVQEKWGSTFDGGAFTLRTLEALVSDSPDTALVAAVITLTLIASVLLFLLCLFDRLPPALLVYTAMTLVITLGGAGFFHAKARFLIPAFPLLLPVARLVARAGRARAAVLLGAGALLSAVYGGHLALVWTHSP